MIRTKTDICIFGVTEPRIAWDRLMREVYARHWAADPKCIPRREEILTIALRAQLSPLATEHLHLLAYHHKLRWEREKEREDILFEDQSWPPESRRLTIAMKKLEQQMTYTDLTDMAMRYSAFEHAIHIDRNHR